MGLVKRIPCTCAAGKPRCRGCKAWSKTHGYFSGRSVPYVRAKTLEDVERKLEVAEVRIVHAKHAEDELELRRAYGHRAMLRKTRKKRFGV